MLSRIFRKALTSIINKCNYKTFTKTCTASKTFWSIHWEVPGNGYFEVRKVNWPLYNIYSLVSPQQQRNYQLEKMMIPIPLLVFISYKSLVQQNAPFTSYLSKTVGYLSYSRNFYAPVSSDKSIWLLVSSAFFEKIGLFVISGS